VNYRQLVYGLLSYLPVRLDSLYRGTGGTGDAAYCYCIWLRHLVLARRNGMSAFPRTVAELGPGDSIGVGIAAVISGAENYIALDVVQHAFHERNAELFHEILRLFRIRAPIPGPEAFPEIAIPLDCYDFPDDILGEDHLQEALAEARIARILRALGEVDSDQSPVSYRAPWTSESAPGRGSIDMILSNAVLEHVEDARATYEEMRRWLRPGGVSSNQIDFRSHGLFATWDGHWQAPAVVWKLMRGRREYLLNLLPVSAHVEAAMSSGLRVEALIRATQPPTGRPSPQHRYMSEADRSTSGAYLLLSRPERDSSLSSGSSSSTLPPTSGS
jgi:hypothetical protein